MPNDQVKTKKEHPLTRRDFLRVTTLSAAGFVIGCAIDPVTGKQTLMLVSEDQEIEIDRRNSPHQFSADNGVVQDQALNDYVSQVGRKMAAPRPIARRCRIRSAS